MQIYNTLTLKKEEFKPADPNHVRLYLCGPTVYGFVHVGNFRGPIFFNFVVNYFKYLGKKVTFVYNYTDVDDKIINQAAAEKMTALELANKYVAEFEKDFALVGLNTFKNDPQVKRVNPRVTETIPEIIALIEDIVKNGAGYVVDGEVFCSIEKIKDYGKLSHKNIDELIAGARVQIGEKKRNPLDFSLWKPAKPGEPFWESPWGKGRPGWHIECSAMAKKYLGDTLDIHGGGIDLIFPHHENEIAQSESANGKPFSRFWMHNNFINMGKEKMSKSIGNIFTARKFVEKYNGEILKHLILSSHYRSPADFGEAVIEHAIAGLARVYSSLCRADELLALCASAGVKPVKGGAVLDPSGFGSAASGFWENIKKAAEDDFNTPEIMAEIFKLIRAYNNLMKPTMKPTPELANTSALFVELVRGIGELMNLFNHPAKEFLIQLDDMLLEQKSLNRAEIQSKVDARFKARQSKDFQLSDQIRDELTKLGIELRDSAEGTQWEVRK